MPCSQVPAPVVPDEKNTIKTITTNSHLKISFDDEKKVLTFETPGGHSVTLDDDRKSITLKDLTGNTIVMSESGLAMTSPKDISIKADGSVSIKGTGGVTVDSPADVSLKGANIVAEGEMAGTFKGGATVELSAGGTTTVKGAMVMIN